MSNPPVINLAARRTKPAPATVASTTDGRQSTIISLCVKYCQLLGAYDAGFKADPSGDSIFAGSGKQIARAGRVLIKLVGLNPHLHPGQDPLSGDEVRALAAVMQRLYGLRNGEQLEPDERLFVRFFALAVADHFDFSGAPRRAEDARHAAPHS